MDTTQLWLAYRQDGDEVARGKLLNEHLGLVHHVARQLSRTLAAEADFDELVSSGVMGLMNALDSFDHSRGLAFSTFAAPRIRGAILDDLRRQDHVPRSLRRKSREIAAAREALTRADAEPPSDRALAEHMNIDVETLWRWKAEIEGIHHVSIEPTGPSGERTGTNPGAFLASETDQIIEDQLTAQEEVGVLRNAILELKEQERVVLSLYYFEELKLHEIAAILELTESRISQIRSKAILKLRAKMASLREEAVA